MKTHFTVFTLFPQVSEKCLKIEKIKFLKYIEKAITYIKALNILKISFFDAKWNCMISFKILKPR